MDSDRRHSVGLIASEASSRRDAQNGFIVVGAFTMGWSMDRQGIRALFDRESRRLKQVELSGSRTERVSLGTYPNELSAREAEVCQEVKYGEWCTPTST